MALEEFNAKIVNPGEPITAEAWNELVSGIREVNAHIRNSQSAALRVQVQMESQSAPAGLLARVTAERLSDGLLVTAAPPLEDGGDYVFAALPAGDYRIHATLAGFSFDPQETEVPAVGPVELTARPDGSFMPNLIGTVLSTALQQLDNAGIRVSRLLDVVGRDIPPGNPGNEYRNSAVLVQLPAPGTAVLPTHDAQLVLATALQSETRVEVPNLTGLTREEARRALEAIGLRLGNVETRVQR